MFTKLLLAPLHQPGLAVKQVALLLVLFSALIYLFDCFTLYTETYSLSTTFFIFSLDFYFLSRIYSKESKQISLHPFLFYSFSYIYFSAKVQTCPNYKLPVSPTKILCFLTKKLQRAFPIDHLFCAIVVTATGQNTLTHTRTSRGHWLLPQSLPNSLLYLQKPIAF